MTGMGIPRLLLSEIFNHVERGVTAVYDSHSYDREKRQAQEPWSRGLQSLIGIAEGETKIVPFFNLQMKGGGEGWLRPISTWRWNADKR